MAFYSSAEKHRLVNPNPTIVAKALIVRFYEYWEASR
jgi:hypothetical protein